MNPSVTTEEKVAWTPIEAATALGISERHLANLTAEGIIPSVKLGRNRRYLPAAVKAAVENLQTEA